MLDLVDMRIMLDGRDRRDSVVVLSLQDMLEHIVARAGSIARKKSVTHRQPPAPSNHRGRSSRRRTHITQTT